MGNKRIFPSASECHRWTTKSGEGGGGCWTPPHHPHSPPYFPADFSSNRTKTTLHWSPISMGGYEWSAECLSLGTFFRKTAVPSYKYSIAYCRFLTNPISVTSPLLKRQRTQLEAVTSLPRRFNPSWLIRCPSSCQSSNKITLTSRTAGKGHLFINQLLFLLFSKPNIFYMFIRTWQPEPKFKEPKNRFQAINSTSLCSLGAGTITFCQAT